jgi:hypothetical protein
MKINQKAPLALAEMIRRTPTTMGIKPMYLDLILPIKFLRTRRLSSV